ncbi:MAG: ABC transporter permease [SAR202 cluster bacterium]|jgi:peptide/nickel transport system permease protein|nr:ABC transporter permease [Chloroflexota bacterium]MDP6422522.1 ABC transporter permease [SAR202 cluster bacterium]HAL48085.1 ABC transporter permease [Dehalococcoidia bacterium]MDP6665122.1 ABC transporter permease [SAR202 cluster bacterium]MDP6799882.1 ABC transporter permease [SAR202 cluster bacterium]|tara:strand:+ start:6549 stop:7499 length:951 start_codon:yes stop_codon:yes gene_type:complete
MAIQEMSEQASPGGASTLLGAAGRSVRSGLSIVLRTNSGRIGFAIVMIHLILAVFGPWLAPYSPTEFDSEDLKIRLTGPSTDHWLGTDQFGRDVLSRVVSGARSIIWISFVGTALGITLGTIVGMTSGYIGGKVDQIIMRGVDILLAFPGLLLALLVINIGAQRINMELWPSKESWLVIITIGIAFMPNNSRVIRSAALAIKPLEFVQSARLRGESSAYIIFREILPNIIPVVAVEASIRVSFALLLTAGLGFLGLGVQPPTPDWGLMVSESRQHLSTAPWAATSPALAMASLVIAVNLLTDGVRQAVRLPSSQEI